MPYTLATGAGPDTLVLDLTQDAYRGPARHTVSVDGIGGTFTALALHGSGQQDTLTFKGDWGVGPHRVSVSFLNDKWDGTAETDRNLYVDAASYNGAAVSGSALRFFHGGSQGFSFVDSAKVDSAAPVPSPAAAPSSTGNFFAASSPWNTKVSAGKAFTEVPGLDALADRGAVGLTSWNDDYASTSIWRTETSDPLVLIRHMDDTWTPVNAQGVKRVGNDAATEASLLSRSDTINQYPQNGYSTQKAELTWNDGCGVPSDQYGAWRQTNCSTRGF